MTPEEYKTLYPQDSVYIQVDDTERLMTDEDNGLSHPEIVKHTLSKPCVATLKLDGSSCWCCWGIGGPLCSSPWRSPSRSFSCSPAWPLPRPVPKLW